MKKFIPKKIFDLIIWQRIKYQNRRKNKEKIFNDWINSGKKIPPPHVVKQKVIKNFQQDYSIEILVETGTFRGEMVYAQKNNFNKIFSIELSKELFEIAKRRLRKIKHAEILNGDSAEVLKEIVPKINKPAIFWLDGHYSGFETAKGSLDTPVKYELEIILKSEIEHIILIDDARMFTGENDYPTIEELKNKVLSAKAGYNFSVEDDIIRIYP